MAPSANFRRACQKKKKTSLYDTCVFLKFKRQVEMQKDSRQCWVREKDLRLRWTILFGM